MPSIVEGLFAGRAGIQSHGAGISVLADNIANANTTGFKSSRADFTDLLAGSISGSAGSTIGSGSSLNSVTPVFTQGSFEFTGRSLDLAVDGNGFFIVQDVNGTGAQLYSRAGNMVIDKDGNLLNQNGYQVLGFPVGGTGTLQALNVNNATQSNVDTDTVTLSGNLDASTTPLAGEPASPTTFTALQAAAKYSTTVQVFDSLGAQHDIRLFFFHSDVNEWTVGAYVDGAEIGLGAGTAQRIGGTAVDGLVFNNQGAKTSATPDFTLAAIPWAGGAAPGNIVFSLTPYTQFATPSTITAIRQDGTGGGSVVSFQVERDGSLVAQLNNGQTSTIGTLALAVFARPEGLQRVGDSLFAQSTTSGEPVYGQPGSGLHGSIEGGALELSTSDIAGDFIKLISLQRGFQGSSRIITSINDLLNEIINLAR